jgi:methionine--tRNA ligase beta chain
MQKPTITYADFEKLDLRIGTIVGCEGVEGSEKLLKFLIDLGDLPAGGGKKTILSGIKKDFQPEKLIGTQVLVLANLEPKKMMGLESQGMILMAVGHEIKDQKSNIKTEEENIDKTVEISEKIVLLVPQEKVESGTGVE